MRRRTPASFVRSPAIERTRDLVWIGNWGDDERAAELSEFLFTPVEALKLDAALYGVRYPEEARQTLARAGFDYGGWLPNFRVPEAVRAIPRDGPCPAPAVRARAARHPDDPALRGAGVRHPAHLRSLG